MNSQYSCWENPIDRNLAGNSPWGHKESDTTEHLSIEHRQQCIMIICMFTYVSVFFILGEQLKKIPGFCSCELPEARSHVCFVPYFISCPALWHSTYQMITYIYILSLVFKRIPLHTLLVKFLLSKINYPIFWQLFSILETKDRTPLLLLLICVSSFWLGVHGFHICREISDPPK